MSVRFQDYYETLGVDKKASQEEIQRAYRKLARKHHPDIDKSPDAEEKFKKINEAYEALKDPRRRAQYDAIGQGRRAGEPFTPPPGYEFHTNGFSFSNVDAGAFSDFFQSIFGEGASAGNWRAMDNEGFGGGARGGWSARGQDVESELTITLEEALQGGAKKIQFERYTSDKHGLQKREPISYDVKIPQGVAEGSMVRLSGQGGAGEGRGKAGDLYLRIRFHPHPRFKPDGHNLRTVIDISPWEAALGAEIEFATLDGEVKLKIPPGSHSGKTLRLRGKGLPNKSGGRGDILATLNIVVPDKLSVRERDLFKQLSRDSSFKPKTRTHAE